MKRFLMTFLLSISCVQHLSAAEIYQCEKDGRMQYSQTPCSQDQKAIGKKVTQDATDSASEKQHRINQLAQDKKEAARLERERHKTEDKRDKENSRQAAKTEKQKSQCDKAHLQVKWAEEDARSASPKSEAKARQKLKRTKEKADLVCRH
jgi:type IV secretory pathway VirB10-like protein